jgi:hypothetical protein
MRQHVFTVLSATMKDNSQMTALTKATLKDSNAIKNIAMLTTVFMPGTYMAVSLRSLPEISDRAS